MLTKKSSRSITQFPAFSGWNALHTLNPSAQGMEPIVITAPAISAAFFLSSPRRSMEKLTSDSLTESVAPDAVREKITVYYSNEIRTDLVPKTYYVNYGAADSMAYVVMNRLIAGPGRDEPGYVRTISSDVRINGIVAFKGNLCVGEFNVCIFII